MRTAEFYLPIFKKGMNVLYKNNQHIVEEVFIRRHDIFLKLDRIVEHIRADKVSAEMTKFTYKPREETNV